MEGGQGWWEQELVGRASWKDVATLLDSRLPISHIHRVNFNRSHPPCIQFLKSFLDLKLLNLSSVGCGSNQWTTLKVLRFDPVILWLTIDLNVMLRRRDVLVHAVAGGARLRRQVVCNCNSRIGIPLTLLESCQCPRLFNLSAG